MNNRHHPCRGFTLLELSVVIIMIGILAVSAVPALDRVTATRQAAALAEVRTALRSVRAHAVALGDPTGLSVDPVAETIAMIWLAPGSTPGPLLDPLGSPEPTIDLSRLFVEAGISSVTLPDGSTGTGTIWFSNEGIPELRQQDGTYAGPATSDAEISLDGAGSVTVDHLTGRIE